MKKNTWYDDGIRFQCQGSGKCCSSRGEYGYVYLNKEDRIKMAECLSLTLESFTEKYCIKYDDVSHHLAGGDGPDCIFLKENKCSVYSGRPTQCRTWPFWPENMNAKVWTKEIVTFCPGVNKGKLFSKQKIDNILEEQHLSEIK